MLHQTSTTSLINIYQKQISYTPSPLYTNYIANIIQLVQARRNRIKYLSLLLKAFKSSHGFHNFAKNILIYKQLENKIILTSKFLRVTLRYTLPEMDGLYSKTKEGN